ncbi:hypothetical protein A2876_04475 [Candidatus Amesbacteria bacterium RIFCSPHIGHO2_01_FULL_48_32b]|uniref:2TM domain-containing protein n=1 Tax=Candidatus Amesbacteria bacterium RIFCSPHIGHO2_01_FULL_48_32b TaxID=1797253 RepID=A0A1F4YCQ1_9BACT|nr:MAG: hypothetical protein A2876_04475 [Candidatus Amesbacteria bacterium RIFCSPHIGHO2_01_FULL_48_32b]
MTDFSKLKERLRKIEERNKRVETDKAWETSYTRRFFIALFTYLSISLYMNAINIDKPWLNAIIPTVGFLLSTLTIPIIKEFWKKHINKS